MDREINKISSLLTIAVTLLFGFQGAPAQSVTGITGNPIFTKSRVFSPETNPAADLDQCANGGVGSLPVVCSGTAWQNGNLGQSQAHYLEGESVPYRLRFSNLAIDSSYTVTIEWDTTENSFDGRNPFGARIVSDITISRNCRSENFTSSPSGRDVTRLRPIR